MSVDFAIFPNSGGAGPTTLNVALGPTQLSSGGRPIGYVHISGDILSVGIVSGSAGGGGTGGQVSGTVAVSGMVMITSGGIIPVAILSGTLTNTNTAVSVNSGLVGVLSGQVAISSGLVGILSGLVGVLSGNVAAQVSGAVIVSGNVGVSGSVQLLSGSALVGTPSAIYSPVPGGPASGQPWPNQCDGSGNQRVSLVGSVATTTSVVSGSVQVSGIVGVSGQVGILSGQLAISSGLVGILSGNIGAQVSGAVIVSGNVTLLSGIATIGQLASGGFPIGTVGITSGLMAVLSGQVAVSSGLIGVLSGSIGATVSGSVIVSGNVGISGSAQLLSGSAFIGTVGSGSNIIGQVILASGVNQVSAPFADISNTNTLSIVASGTTVALQSTQGCATLFLSLMSGTGSGGGMRIEGSPDAGVSWFPLNVVNPATGALQSVISGPTMGSTASGWLVAVAGCNKVRAFVTSSGTGSVTINSEAGAGGNLVSLANPLPAGSNLIGNVAASILSGQHAVSSGLIGILSGNIGAQVSGAIQVSGIVGISGAVGILSGQVSVSSGLVGILSGSVGAQVSGAVQVSGIVGISGSVGILSGQVSVSSGLVSILSGLVGILSGQVQVTSGSVTLLSGANTVGALASGNNIIGAPFADISTLSQNLTMSTDTTQTVSLSVHGCGSVVLQITGTWTGVIAFEGTVDGTNWFFLDAKQIGAASIVSAVAANANFSMGCAGLAKVRARTFTVGTGTAVINIGASAGSESVYVNNLSLSAQVSGAVIVSGNVGILSGSALMGGVEIRPSNSGGLSLFRAFSGLTNTGSGVNVISGAHQLFNVGWANFVASGMWAKLYDNTAAPTVGTTTPILTIAVSSGGVPTFVPLAVNDVGLQINNGLWVSLTGGGLDGNTTNVSGQSGQAMMWFMIRSGL